MNWGEFFQSRWWQLIAMGMLLAASGFFSGTETALFNLTRGQLYRLGRGGGRTGKIVASLMREPRSVLQTLLLGNMLVNVAYAATSATIVFAMNQQGLQGWALAIASLAPLLALILLGEVTPKMLAYRVGEQWALVAAGPLTLAKKAFRPVVFVLGSVLIEPITRLIAPGQAKPTDITAAELNALLDLSARRGLIGRDANALLREITQLTDIRVAGVMVPRVDMIAYEVNGAPAGLIDLFRKTHLRKIPVFEGNVDHVLGVVYAKQLLLNPQQDLRSLVAKIAFVPETANIERALLQLRVTRRQMAFVVDEYGGLAGLVTLEDIIEEIVGDIEETTEPGRELPVQKTDENEYIIAGNLAIHDWAEAFEIDLTGERISTVGGFVTSLLGKIPSAGDVADYRNLRFTVLETHRRRILKLRLELQEVE